MWSGSEQRRPSRLIDRRPGALVDEDVDGRSLLDETALREHAACSSRPWRRGRRQPSAHAAERDSDRHDLVVGNGKGRTRHVTVGSGTIAAADAELHAAPAR